MPQLFDIGRVPTPDRPRFDLTIEHPRLAAPKLEIYVLIHGIKAENGSGNSWLVEGYVPNDELAKAPWLKSILGSSDNIFHGVINTRQRTGTIVAGHW